MPPLALRDYFSKRILGFLNWKGNRRHYMSMDWLERLTEEFQALQPDHVAVTGDVTNLALKGEFENGRKWLHSLGPAELVSVVPGNHDAYVSGAFARHSRQWSPWMSGDDSPEKVSFPYLRRRGGVMLIGTSTALSLPPFLAGGVFGRRQARRLKRLLRDPGFADDFKVVMIHHPPHPAATIPPKALYDAWRFREVIRTAGADLILHGHTHLASFATIAGPAGPVPVIGVPAASSGPGAIQPAARFNLFEIERCGTGWRCLWSERGFDSESGEPVLFRDRFLIHPERVPSA